MTLRFRLAIRSGLTAGLLASAVGGRAGEFHFDSACVRGGFSATSGFATFRQVEGFAKWNLPWQWDLGRQWRVQSQVEVSAGWLSGRGEDGFVGTAGPAFALRHAQFPLALVIGSSPTVLSREEFATTNYGQPIQFTSYLGCDARLGAGWSLGYRFQHMSNGGLASPNPGLNLHMLAASWQF